MSSVEIGRRFVYHAPTETTRQIHEEWRTHAVWLAEHLNDLQGGDTREKALAFTAMEEMTFWIHAHIARNLSTEWS